MTVGALFWIVRSVRKAQIVLVGLARHEDAFRQILRDRRIDAKFGAHTADRFRMHAAPDGAGLVGRTAYFSVASAIFIAIEASPGRSSSTNASSATG
jgi:hypothetical protein